MEKNVYYLYKENYSMLLSNVRLIKRHKRQSLHEQGKTTQKKDRLVILNKCTGLTNLEKCIQS